MGDNGMPSTPTTPPLPVTPMTPSEQEAEDSDGRPKSPELEAFLNGRIDVDALMPGTPTTPMMTMVPTASMPTTPVTPNEEGGGISSSSEGRPESPDLDAFLNGRIDVDALMPTTATAGSSIIISGGIGGSLQDDLYERLGPLPAIDFAGLGELGTPRDLR